MSARGTTNRNARGSAAARRARKPSIPEELCGVEGCCYLRGHDGRHTWE